MPQQRERGTLRRRRLMGLLAGSAAGLAGCAGGPGTSGTPTEPAAGEGGTLVVANESDLTGLDPHGTASVVSWNVIYNVCETLLTFEDGELAGRLASDWSVSDDGMEYTVELKESVRFHPPVDRELVADDVVYSFERMRQPAANMSGDLAVVDSIEATDDYEVRFTLERTFSPFLQYLARVPWVIVPREAVEEQTDGEFGVGEFQAPVGTGPFALDEHVQGERTVLRAFDDYHVDAPFLDGVRLTPVPDGDTRGPSLRNGDVDVARGVPGKDADSLDARDDVRIIVSDAAAWGQVYINNSREPWDDPAVRRAVAHLVDRQAIVDAGLFGYGRPAWQPFPEASPWYVEPESPRRREPTEAERILDDAGNPLEGETLTIKTTPAYRIMESTADVLAQNLREAGIDAEIDSLEWGTLLDDFLGGNFDAMTFSVPLKVDPDRYFYSFLHPDGPQYLRYGEDQPDAARMYELVERGRAVTDREERRAIYAELQALIQEHVPWISIAHSHGILGIREEVHGDPTWMLPYNRYWPLSKQS